MSSEEKWEKHLYADRGKVWLRHIEPGRIYEVIALALCRSEAGESFWLWFQLAQCPLEFDAPDQPHGFWINIALPDEKCRFTLRARPRKQATEPPARFLDLCLSLLHPSDTDGPSGYTFSTDVRLKVMDQSAAYEGLPLKTIFSDPDWDPRKGRVLQFAHLAKPFTLVWDKNQYECKQCRSAQQFEAVLKERYNRPLDRLY